MLYLSNDGGDVEMAESSTSSSLTSSNGIRKPWSTVIEDEIDQYLNKQDGRIYRKKNEMM